MRQLRLYDRSPPHCNTLVIQVRGDACAWADLNNLGTHYVAINHAGDHQVRHSHLALDAPLVADHQLAGLVGQRAHAAVHAAFHDQLSSKHDVAVDMRTPANEAALFNLRLLILANHIMLPKAPRVSCKFLAPKDRLGHLKVYPGYLRALLTEIRIRDKTATISGCYRSLIDTRRMRGAVDVLFVLAVRRGIDMSAITADFDVGRCPGPHSEHTLTLTALDSTISVTAPAIPHDWLCVGTSYIDVRLSKCIAALLQELEKKADEAGRPI